MAAFGKFNAKIGDNHIKFIEKQNADTSFHTKIWNLNAIFNNLT